MKKIFLLLLCLAFCGCSNKPAPEVIANLDYGDPPTVDYQNVIQKYFVGLLFDPLSANFEQENMPTKFWYMRPRSQGGGLCAGYIVYVRVNAKNIMGGYSGYQLYGFIFKDDQIIQVLNPDDLARMHLQ